VKKLIHPSLRHEQIGAIPSFAAKSDFWVEIRALASEHLASEARLGRPSIGDPRARWQATLIFIWFALSYGALLAAPSFTMPIMARSSAGRARIFSLQGYVRLCLGLPGISGFANMASTTVSQTSLGGMMISIRAGRSDCRPCTPGNLAFDGRS
jgi:hypothetical protein